MKINPNKWWNVKTRLILPHSVNLSEKTCHFTPQKWWNICFSGLISFASLPSGLCVVMGPNTHEKSPFFLFPPSSFLKSDLPFRWNRCSVVPFFCKRCWTHNRPFFRLSFFVNWFFLYCNHMYSQGGWCRNWKIPVEFKRIEALFHRRVRIRWTYQPKNASNSSALEKPLLPLIKKSPHWQEMHFKEHHLKRVYRT